MNNMSLIWDCIKFSAVFIPAILVVPGLIWFVQVVKEEGHPVHQFFQRYKITWRIRLGCIADFPIFLHLSVFLWVIFWMFGDIHDLQGILILVSLWVSILIHELSHAISCRLLGLGIGSITLWFLGGYFIPLSIDKTPFQLDGSERKKYILMIVSGPISNILLAGSAFAISQAFATDFFLDVTRLNLFLALLNLFPIPQLDGGQIIYLYLAKYFDWKSMYRVVGILLIILSIVDLILPFTVENYPHHSAYLVGIVLGGGISALRTSQKSDDELEKNYQEAVNRERAFVFGNMSNAG